MNNILSIHKIPIKALIFNFLFFLISFSLYELFIGGGGRFVEIGTLTLRMYLFFFLLTIGLIIITLKGRIDKVVSVICFIFLFTLLISTAVGIINGADMNYIYEDVKPLFYFFSILYFFQFLSFDSIPRIIQIIKISGIVLALTYCLFLVLLFFKFINFSSFYAFSKRSGEIFFRDAEGLFFYKGFLYLNIAFFFYLLDKTKKALLISVFIALSIVLTLTRGFIFSLGICLFIYYFFINKNNIKKIVLFFVGILIFILYLIYVVPLLGDKTISNNQRLLQINQVFESVNMGSIIWGHGFGIGVPIRPVHMEISYLEIFHKQGIIGLFFWIGLLFLILYYYFKIKALEYDIVNPFLLGTLFIYFQTFTNPYLNNPIGMSFVILTLLVFRTIYLNKSHDLRLHPNL